VLTAYNQRELAAKRTTAIAAALRAAANELGYRIIFDDGETEYRIDVTDLLAIADELEGAAP
jgi:hypothetical protein